MLALGLMAGCGGQGALPQANTAAASTVAGFAFATVGRDLVVSRHAAPLTYSDGLPAKRAAMAHCAGQGAQLNPAAFGQFTSDGFGGGYGGGWQFAGGCVR
jgi:hypothetical protein